MQTRRSILKSTASLGLLPALPGAAFAKAPLTGTQAPGFYRMRLGDLEITALSDGTVALPMAQIYQGLSEADIGARQSLILSRNRAAHGSASRRIDHRSEIGGSFSSSGGGAMLRPKRSA